MPLDFERSGPVAWGGGAAPPCTCSYPSCCVWRRIASLAGGAPQPGNSGGKGAGGGEAPRSSVLTVAKLACGSE